MYKDLIWIKHGFVMYCFSLKHAVSQAKCQKSYLLNTQGVRNKSGVFRTDILDWYAVH
jgi:hypothetical protein